jgi:UDP-N-acetylglucosamine:LPS N-acetylglucosamine transferase
MEKKKIFMPHVEAGSGHKIPAMAVKESIEAFYPDKYQIDVVDFAKESGALKDDKALKGNWEFLLRFPVLARLGYKIMWGTNLTSETYLKFACKEWLEKGSIYLKNYGPAIVFTPHMFSFFVCAYIREKYKMPIKLIGYITDPFDACPWWAEKRMDWIIVASEIAKQKLLKLGIEEKKILIMPFPVKRSFFNISKSKDELVKQYGLDPSKPTILTSAGGQGIGTSSAKYVEMIYRRGMPFNVLFVCGRNENLKAQLDKLTKEVKSETVLVPFGYISNMNELLSISDFTIAKAGASTTMESLMMGCPIIYTDWAACNEWTNIEFAMNNKAGWYAPSQSSFLKIINEIRNTGILKIYKENTKKLNLKTGSDEIAKFVVEQLEEQ